MPITLKDNQPVTFMIPGRNFPAWGTVRDYRDEGVVIVQRPSILKGNYTDTDKMESRRMNALVPLRDGDEVLFNGALHRVKILGDYSDAGRLVPIPKD